MTNQTEIKHYLNQVKKHCPYPLRKKLIKELESNLSDFVEQYPDSTMTDIIEHFGSPGKFTDEYILAMDEPERQRIVQKSKWMKRLILLAALLILLIISVTAVWIIHENSRNLSYYYYEEITYGGIIE